MVRSTEIDGRSRTVDGRSVVPVPVQPTTIDSFEHEDVVNNGWTTSGENNWTYTDTLAVDGSVDLTHANGGETLSSLQGGGLPLYPQQGDEILFEGQTSAVGTGGSQALNFYFGVEDGGNEYRVDLDFADDNLELWHIGPNDRLAVDFGAGWAADTHYRVSIEWDDGSTFGGSAGDMNVSVADVDADADQVSVSGNENSRSTGGVRFDHRPEADESVHAEWLRVIR